MFTVVQQALIPAPVARTWGCLTRPQMLRQWFAEAEGFKMGETFRLDFGDGDFFVGSVREWQEPSLLRVEWKFMGLGPLFEITYRLQRRHQDETEVMVTDRGSLTEEESRGLLEGWEDFLSRLARFARTGESARYVWNQTIDVGAILKTAEGGEWLAEVSNRAWWRRWFKASEVEFGERRADTLHVCFTGAGWEGVGTEARLQLVRSDFGAYLRVSHDGWTRLPEARRITERKRYASMWRNALGSLESRYA